jgi:hypothetical protein
MGIFQYGSPPGSCVRALQTQEISVVEVVHLVQDTDQTQDERKTRSGQLTMYNQREFDVGLWKFAVMDQG